MPGGFVGKLGEGKNLIGLDNFIRIDLGLKPYFFQKNEFGPREVIESRAVDPAGLFGRMAEERKER